MKKARAFFPLTPGPRAIRMYANARRGRTPSKLPAAPVQFGRAVRRIPWWFYWAFFFLFISFILNEVEKCMNQI